MSRLQRNALAFCIAFCLTLVAGLVLAGHPDATSEARSDSSADSSVIVSPRRSLLLGGSSSGSDSTSPCMERRPSWVFGARGDRTRLNAECWQEYLAQAEHEREMDRQRLELERLRLEIERDRLKLESELARDCIECEALK